MKRFVTRGPKEPKESQGIEGSSNMRGVGGACGHGDDTGAPSPSGPRASTPADEEDVDDPAGISSIGMELLQPESEDVEEEMMFHVN